MRKANPREVAVIVCNHVYQDERPVLLASRDDQLVCLLCGLDDHTDSVEAFKVVGSRHLVERDPSIGEVLDLPIGHEAARAAIDDEWVRGVIHNNGI